MRTFATVLFLAGWWFILHGGGGMMGLYGFERFLQAHNQVPVSTTLDYLREFFCGIALLIPALIIIQRTKQLGPKAET